MKHIKIPIPSVRWLTISWGEQKPAATPTPTPAAVTEQVNTQANTNVIVPPELKDRGRYSQWLKETGRHRVAWERYYQINRPQLNYVMMQTGHKAPFSQEEIMKHGKVFKRYLEQRTDPDTQGLGRPRLRSI